MPNLVAETSDASCASDALYRQSVDGCLEAAIGKHGLAPAELERWLKRLDKSLAELQAEHAERRLPLLRVPERSDDIDEAAAALARLSNGARTILFFGTGGSSLGGQTLAQLAGWNIPGGADARQRARPRTRFYDNLDGSTLAGAFEALDLVSTRFVVTSKSGNTAETLAQAIVALDAVKHAGLGSRIPEFFLGITEPDKPSTANGLRKLFVAHGIPMLEHDTGVGGRFSCLTNVGLMPALARGLDARAVRAGAQVVVKAMLAARSARDFAPAVGAATAIALAKEKGVRTLVLMPYADRLGRFSQWFVQLWAESLGKKGEGTSPIAALGPLDQHSQLQLFMDGPRELYVTVLRTPTHGRGPIINPELAQMAGVAYMGGRSVGDIVDAQAHAVPRALAEAGRPVRTFDLAQLDERSVGALLMHFMLETILAGRLLGIDPFDQPAVELAKKLTKERLAQEQ